MAHQDDIIIIRTVENITTSILDYFLNVALVTEITEDDLIAGQTFSTGGKEEYASLEAMAEKFNTDSRIYKFGRDIFAQKTKNQPMFSFSKRVCDFVYSLSCISFK